jgi:nucleotide-binding universal stress UspA family protein
VKILLTHDGSAMADVAVPTVHTLANALGDAAEVTALCITSSHASPESTEARDADESLDRIRRALEPHPVTLMMRGGSPGPLIVETAEELGCDLVAMSTSGMSGSKHFLGSVADYVARNSHEVPVMFCRPAVAGTKHFRKILLPLDGSPQNAGAIAETQRLGLATGASVVLLRLTDDAGDLRSVRTPAGYALSTDIMDDATVERVITAELEIARSELAEVANQLRQAGLQDILAVVMTGTPGETIVRAAETRGCDVIVMSSHGRGRGPGAQLLGSVADHVLQHVGEATVIVAPPPDGASA